MRAARLSSVVFVSLLLSSQLVVADDDCKCLAVAGDVSGAIQVDVARADSLYSRGDFEGAGALYAKAYAQGKVSVLLYAQGMAKWRSGANDQARALFDAYLKAGGTLAYRAKAEAYVRDLGGPSVTGTVGGAVGTGLGLTDRVGERVGVEGVTPPTVPVTGCVTADVTG